MFQKFYNKKVEIEKPALKKLPHTTSFAKRGYFVPFWPVDAGNNLRKFSNKFLIINFI